MKRCSRCVCLTALVLSVLMMLTACGSIGQTIKTQKPSRQSAAVTPNTKQVSVKPVQVGVSEDTDDYNILNFEEVARNSNSILYADMKSGHFALQNIETEAIWYDVPNNTELDEITTGTERMEVRSQLIVRYILKIEESTTSSYKTETSQSVVRNGGASVELIENGIKVTYQFTKCGITLPVRFYLTNDSLRAEIVTEEIDEGKDSYLIGVDLLPVFGAGDWDDEGYAFVPDGSGALIDFSYHKDMQVPYEKAVYGEEKAVKPQSVTYKEEPILLPVFGVTKGENSLMGIITEGDADASVTAFYHSDTYGYTAPSSIFNYRVIDTKTMFAGQGGISNTIYRVSEIKASTDVYRVEYSALSGEYNGYVGMAKKYRDYLKENSALNSAVKSPTLNLEIYGAADLTTSFLGFDYSTTEVLTTASQAKTIIEKLKAAGIGDISVRYKGFGGDGILNRKINTSTSPISKIGSAKELAELGKLAVLYPDYDFMQVRESGNGLSFKEDIVYTLFDYKAPQYIYSRSTYSKLTEDDVYLLSPPAILGSLNSLLESYKNADYKNISLSSIGLMLYSDLHTEKGMYRDEALQYINKVLENSSEKCDNVAVEGANAYTLKYADKIWSVPVYSSGYNIFSTDVPFYQIAVHGNITMTSSGIIQAQEPRVAILKAVETGSELLFGCTYEESTVLIGSRYEELYSTAYENWMDYAVNANEKYSPVLEKIYDKQIVNHTEASDGVFITEYEGGIRVAVNYGDTAVTLASGEKVEAMDYTVLNGGADNE